MPKLPMDYSKCCIYKIEHINDESLVYVGHTNNFDKRKCEHKSRCMNEKYNSFNSRLYQLIRDNGGWDSFKMIEVQKYPCNDKREAEKRENEVMKELKANMNTIKSFRTQEEIQGYGKDYMKKYNKVNKYQILEKKRIYYELNKEELKKKMKKHSKNNYEKNKVKVKCECGCEISKKHLPIHQRTDKHNELMKLISI